MKLNSIGNIEWQNTIGGNAEEGLGLSSVAQTSDGGFTLEGHSQSGTSGDKIEVNIGSWDYWVVKLECDTKIKYFADVDGDEYGDVGNTGLFCGFVVAGYSSDSTDCDDTNENIYPSAPEILNGIDDNCNNEIDEELVNINSIENNFLFTIYPNPANNKITIAFNEPINTEAALIITDITGKLISTINLISPKQQIEIDISAYAASLYFVKLQYDGITDLQKFIKQ